MSDDGSVRARLAELDAALFRARRELAVLRAKPRASDLDDASGTEGELVRLHEQARSLQERVDVARSQARSKRQRLGEARTRSEAAEARADDLARRLRATFALAEDDGVERRIVSSLREGVGSASSSRDVRSVSDDEARLAARLKQAQAALSGVDQETAALRAELAAAAAAQRPSILPSTAMDSIGVRSSRDHMSGFVRDLQRQLEDAERDCERLDAEVDAANDVEAASERRALGLAKALADVARALDGQPPTTDSRPEP